MRLLLVALVLCFPAPAWAQGGTEAGAPAASVEDRIEDSLSTTDGDAGPAAGELRSGDFVLPSAEPALARPDASLAEPTGPKRLPTPIDTAIGQRIDKGLTAAGEASAFPPDFAYGAFQRGYFLTAFALALTRAERGDAVAQTLLGELLSRGLGVKQDIPAALDWYGLAARQNEPEALYSLGRFHLEGIGVAPDFAKAADYLESAAKRAHPGAAREFAYLLLQGKGREKNPMLAAAHLRRAAGLGDMDAQYTLAGLYAEGVGVAADDGQAARWYEAAARNGHVGAEIEYAIMLFNGRGVPKDEASAARWLQEAARADNPLAQIRLARILAEGRGLEADPPEAARWYLIAKERGLQDGFMEDWLTRLDAPARAAAAEAAQKWTNARPRLVQAAADPPEDGAPVDKQVQ